MKIHRIWEVGDVCWAVSDGFMGPSMLNDVGGTAVLPKGRYKVRITKQWDDYEVGQRMHAVLLEDKDIAIARKAGTTGFSAEHYRRKYPANPKLAEDAAKALKEWNPAKVYVSEHECEPLEMERKVTRGR